MKPRDRGGERSRETPWRKMDRICRSLPGCPDLLRSPQGLNESENYLTVPEGLGSRACCPAVTLLAPGPCLGILCSGDYGPLRDDTAPGSYGSCLLLLSLVVLCFASSSADAELYVPLNLKGLRKVTMPIISTSIGAWLSLVLSVSLIHSGTWMNEWFAGNCTSCKICA